VRKQPEDQPANDGRSYAIDDHSRYGSEARAPGTGASQTTATPAESGRACQAADRVEPD
jgi:hypothetical protein